MNSSCILFHMFALLSLCDVVIWWLGSLSLSFIFACSLVPFTGVCVFLPGAPTSKQVG